ncbi:MAG TPA: rhodanese family protein [Burkholderiales bacterium]|nr:rhodanese family protein [Burkholderiales bacterium]
MIHSIDPLRLKQWLERGEAVLIDVREPAEYRAAHIPAATLLPLGQVGRTALPGVDGKKLVMHCKAGKRGQEACDKLTRENTSLEVYNLEGGIEAWEKAGLPVEKSGRVFLPLDRQVQAVVGSLVLLGTLLGYLAHPAFLIIAGFFGAGLLFAGLTGFCGLAHVLARMPWNR